MATAWSGTDVDHYTIKTMLHTEIYCQCLDSYMGSYKATGQNKVNIKLCLQNTR